MTHSDESAVTPFRVKPWFSPRPWGRRSLEPWYSAAQVGTAESIGEAWLTGPECIVETGPLNGQTVAQIAVSHAGELLGPETGAGARPAEFPLLIKLLFPSEKLSVQVHPDDAHAQAMGQSRGKTECWYVLSAEPDAQIALGFKPMLSVRRNSIRAAIGAGKLEELLNWIPVAAGDMFFVDAGTVHAIGPGMVLLETQQTSDITFRMYDYGRPRELHVEQALRVMKTHTAAGKIAPRKLHSGAGTEATRLIEQQYFVVDRYDLSAGSHVIVPTISPGCLIALSGSATVQSDASQPAVDLLHGHAAVLPVDAEQAHVRVSQDAAVIHAWQPLHDMAVSPLAGFAMSDPH